VTLPSKRRRGPPDPPSPSQLPPKASTRSRFACISALSCEDCEVRTQSICGALEPEELDELARIGHSRAIAATAHLFEQGDPQHSVFNVTSGFLRLSHVLPDGRRHVVGFVLPGEFIGLAPDEIHRLTAEALTSAIVCQFPLGDFYDLVGRKRKMLHALLDLAAHKLGFSHEQTALVAHGSALQRLAAFLADLMGRIARVQEPSEYLPLPMTRLDIAERLGLTIETVSRSFSLLAHDGILVVMHAGVRVIDPARLGQIASGC
jgi:CRP/FNR family transcriptional regulator, anaerobic regulatory protein